MKHIKTLALFILAFSLLVGSLTSCDVLEELKSKIPGLGDSTSTPDDGENDNGGENDGGNGETPVVPEKTKEEIWRETYSCITIAEALELCGETAGEVSTERYYIIATVDSVDDTAYGKLMISDSTGEIMVYGTNSHDGQLKFDKLTDQPKAGDLILIYGTLQNYNGTKEVQNAWLIDLVHKNAAPDKPTVDVSDIKPGDTITVAEALELAKTSNGTDRYYIVATVSAITNAQYGAMTIEDETGSISIYNSKNADGSVDYQNMTDKPYKGDTVKVYCTLHLYNTTPEIASAYIVEFTHNTPDVNENDYTDMSIEDARKTEKGTLIKVDGVVAKLTYANGQIPSGFYLVDETSSFYVYDRDAAARVKEGNTVTLLGAKDYWINEKEISAAEKYNYKGCNQLTNVTVLECDDQVSEYDKSWITESTVLDMLETPVTEDVTTLIYKVNALVKKVPGSGFVNYYFFDIDGVTGNYVYTQCNGSDFAWLDKFDGKICTVYLSLINAKASTSDCFFRFFPVEVIDESYSFDPADSAWYAVKYHGVGQFVESYGADPALELTTSVSSELLGIEGVKLSYSSGNTTSVYFEEIDGKVIMHCGEAGNAAVTVSATHNGVTYTETVNIAVLPTGDFSTVTVGEAIAAEKQSTVTVKGIVGPSLVNKEGFYLIDETGAIAVLTDAATIDTLSLGNEVILEGTRDHWAGSGNFGQSLINNAKVLVNLYGNHEYSDASFVDTTIEEYAALDTAVDRTSAVYRMDVKIKVVVTTYYTNVYVDSEDGSISILLYAGSGNQYSWLFDYDGEIVTIEFAACNWNAKKDNRGCVLALIKDDGTKICNTLNFDRA